MPSADHQKSTSVRGSMPGTEIRVLARSMFRDFVDAGYHARDMIAFATELLDLVISSLRRATSDPAVLRDPQKAPDEEGR